LAYDFCHLAIGKLDFPTLAALTGKIQGDPNPVERHVFFIQRRCSSCVSFGNRLRISNSQVATIQQADNSREDSGLTQSLPIQIFAEPSTNARKDFCEQVHSVKLTRRAGCLPLGVIDVLRAARIVDSASLDVALRVWADPNFGPRRRDGQRD
jgi:hypothetical protein